MLIGNTLLGEVSYVVEQPTQEGYDRLQSGDDLARRYLEGVLNICVDMRIKGNGQIARIWLSNLPEGCSGCRRESELPVLIRADDNQSRQHAPEIVARSRMHVQRLDDRKGRFIFVSVRDARCYGDIAAPKGWLTGATRTDAWQQRRYVGEDAPEVGQDAVDLWIETAVVATIRVEVARDVVSVSMKDGADVPLEIVDLLIGPFNTR
ncbi:MAG: hypothetical protein AB7G08_23930 [Hyphomicrobiaceae bacterium]